jgi:uncharacterized protein (DUF1810 family)
MYSIERFLKAQEKSYEIALQELTNGKKCEHWMWYIFPQLKALGRSETAVFYGIVDANEAKSYLNHPILKARLTACCKAILLHKDRSALEILGDVDAMKLKSSMTLFALVCGEESSIFHQVLVRFYSGKMDKRTQGLLALQTDK